MRHCHFLKASSHGASSSGGSTRSGGDSPPPPPQARSSGISSFNNPSSPFGSPLSSIPEIPESRSSEWPTWDEFHARFNSDIIDSESSHGSSPQHGGCPRWCCCIDICEVFRSCCGPREPASERGSGDQVRAAPNINTDEVRYTRVISEDDSSGTAREKAATPSTSSRTSPQGIRINEGRRTGHDNTAEVRYTRVISEDDSRWTARERADIPSTSSETPSQDSQVTVKPR